MFTFDASTGLVKEANWLTLLLGMDVAGQVLHRPIDVITESELPAMLKRYASAFDALEGRFEHHRHDLLGAAHASILLYQRDV